MRLNAELFPGLPWLWRCPILRGGERPGLHLRLLQGLGSDPPRHWAKKPSPARLGLCMNYFQTSGIQKCWGNLDGSPNAEKKVPKWQNTRVSSYLLASPAENLGSRISIKMLQRAGNVWYAERFQQAQLPTTANTGCGRVWVWREAAGPPWFLHQHPRAALASLASPKHPPPASSKWQRFHSYKLKPWPWMRKKKKTSINWTLKRCQR